MHGKVKRLKDTFCKDCMTFSLVLSLDMKLVKYAFLQHTQCKRKRVDKRRPEGR